MAAQHVNDARRAKAAQDQARELAAISRKIDLIMAHLGIEEVPVEGADESAPSEITGDGIAKLVAEEREEKKNAARRNK